MDAIPLCDIIKTYTDIYVNTQQILFNTILFYFVVYWRKYLYMLLYRNKFRIPVFPKEMMECMDHLADRQN